MPTNNRTKPFFLSAVNILQIGIAGLLVFGAMYVAGFGVFDDTYVRVGALTLAVFLFLLSASWGSVKRPAGWFVVDAVMSVLMAAAIYRYFVLSEELESGLYDLTTEDIVFGCGGILVLLEMSRRVVGLPLVIFCVFAISYALLGGNLPGMLGHSGVDFGEFLLTLWYSFDGVYGRPMAVVSTTILVFIIFGSVLEAMGIGDVLLKISVRVAGGLRGGAAHAAVVASGLFGTISGSAVANVVGTGVITIPMIKRSGFKAKFAGAVEAAASSGGQLMPPVMGAVAFIMADVTGIPYLQICIAALIPALFYYASLFSFIAIEARVNNIPTVPLEERPKITRRDWLMCTGFIAPLTLVIVMLTQGTSPAYAGFWAVILSLFMGFAFTPKLLTDSTALIAMLKSSGRASATILVAVAAVGLIIAVMNMTGLGIRFAGAIQTLGEGSLFLSLIVMMFGCLILGMGMPTVPAYLIIILVMGTAVEGMGVPTIAAHLFVVYFAALSAVTPPVALAAFAAAPIAKASPLGIGAVCVRISLIGFLIPYVFVYEPSLLLITDFNALGFIWAIIRLIVSIALLTMGVGQTRLISVATMILAIVILTPALELQLISLVLSAFIIVKIIRAKKNSPINTTITSTK